MLRLPMRVQAMVVRELRAIGDVVENGDIDTAMQRLQGLSDYMRRMAEKAPMPATAFHSLRVHERLRSRRRDRLAVGG